MGKEITLPNVNKYLKKFTSVESLASLPVTRKSSLSLSQSKEPPFGGYTVGKTSDFDHIFQNP